MAQSSHSTAAKKPQKSFLITTLPHPAVRLMSHLDDPALHLSEKQKSELLTFRKEVIATVQNIGKKVFPLEKQVAKEIFSGKTPDELSGLVQKIAGLKAEATMVQLRCLYSFRSALDQQQLDVLIK
jgi:hypothetical protein